MSYVNERTVLGKANSTLTLANTNQYYAVRVNPSAANSDKSTPPVALTQGTADLDVVYGEAKGFRNDLLTVQQGGIVTLRCALAYVAADNGKGVRTSTTAGVVSVGDFGVGAGHIVGGGTKSVGGANVNVLFVDLG